MRMHTEAEQTPSHYQILDGKDIHDIERNVWGDEAYARHLTMAAFEYIARSDKKGTRIQDLKKAQHCLAKAVAALEAGK